MKHILSSVQTENRGAGYLYAASYVAFRSRIPNICLRDKAHVSVSTGVIVCPIRCLCGKQLLLFETVLLHQDSIAWQNVPQKEASQRTE
jgi:hypothetical protein